MPQAISGGFIFQDLIWSTYRFYAAALPPSIIGLVWLLIEKTPYGAIIKAGAHDSEIVRALGINLSRLRLAVFVFGTMLAAVAGIIVAPIWGIRPHMGVDAVVPAFLVIVLGGVGSFWGAVLAGILVGLVVGLSGAYASEWSLLSMYILLVAVVTFRARGLFGKKSVLEADERRLAQFADAARLITPTMLVVWLLLATHPALDSKIGLYPYLGIEILIWSIYALSFNLVLGTAGLPSFGHGVLFRHRRLCVRAVPVQLVVQSVGLSCRGGARGRLSPARWSRCSSRIGAASITPS